MITPLAQFEQAWQECASATEDVYLSCAAAAPNYGVTDAELRAALRMAVEKYLCLPETETYPAAAQITSFVGELQVADLYLAIACAKGNEFAWWEFDQTHRRYIERVARHLASAETDAEEVLDSVYVELYGTRVIDGVRQSKFATYSGRGTLRGWLRTVVWHAVIDLHRAKHDEISVEDWSETGGEIQDRPGWRAEAYGGEKAATHAIERDRYGASIRAALDTAIVALADHEKLLLLYYHVENLKLREIARLVENPKSPLRRWFQRHSRQRVTSPESRVHESTVMRWLEKVYGKILKSFRQYLEQTGSLSAAEIEICMEMATEDLAGDDVRRHLLT